MTEVPTNDVLNVKLDYIQKDIAVIKADVKEIKADYVTRREFETQLRDSISFSDSKIVTAKEVADARFGVLETRTDKLYNIVYWFLGLVGAATIVSLLPKLAGLISK